jgi:hypothetical protein
MQEALVLRLLLNIQLGAQEPWADVHDPIGWRHKGSEQ